jgi:dTDP-4-amino-4,6-dideoxygalactose transaminase
VLITNSKKLAERAQLFRNHGEVLASLKTKHEMTGILGYGYLMDEMSAALAWVQVTRVDSQIRQRNKNAQQLNKLLQEFDFLHAPVIERNCTHAFYTYLLRYDERKTDVPLGTFVKALTAEGIPAGAGYYEPLYWNPVYDWKVFYGKDRYPYNLHPRNVTYGKGDCPVVERLFQHEAISTTWVHPRVNVQDKKDIVRAIEKISHHMSELRHLNEI